MGEMKRKSLGISKMLAVIVIAVIIVIASVGGAYWYLFIREEQGEVIKVGIIGPMEWVQGIGMKQGAILAAEEINANGGVLVNKTSGERRNIALYFGDEGTDPATGTLSMERLITVDGVDFVIGGFRTEIVFPMREVAMDYKKIFMIAGSATTELIDCRGTEAYPCGQCVYDNYPRYKYLFRVTPPNTSVLFSYVLVPFLKFHLIPKVLNPRLGLNITKVAIVVEKAAWTDYLRGLIQNAGALFLGPDSKIVYQAYPDPLRTDFEAELAGIEDSGAQLILHVFSAEAGAIFIKQWGERQIPAVPVGVDVLGQESDHWDLTGGKCKYETMLSSPPRAGLTNLTVQFWDNYVDRFGHDPIYTSFGTYDGMYILKDAIERAESINSDDVVVELEKTDKLTTFARFKFTKTHDVWVGQTYIATPLEEPPFVKVEWLPTEYVVPLIVQWQVKNGEGQRVIVYPFNQTYTEDFEIPSWMLPTS